ncbi:MAG: hypothetical protein A2172_05025 [Candidatus Woykebacteria bacterium RBG_13_40_15]|uniref:Uncharacterized protein n=1 Tax=Candidatus Woykebacteria bacterium RBG_13_40_15 TaxID=1802593 RepID=A0A1G1W864_9BACT|nr:MAG: hypothetical protein A2172_05025 [Candidatus Woykebacteria bacterium RBG_13_40_15]
MVSYARKTVEEELREVVSGEESDSLVAFHDRLRAFAMRHRTVAIVGVRKGVRVQLTISKDSTALKIGNRLDPLGDEELKRFLDNPERENVVERLAHDLLDDLWRMLAGQEVDEPIVVTVGVSTLNLGR